MESGLVLFMKKIGWHITVGEIVDLIGVDNVEKEFKYGNAFLSKLRRVKVIED